MHNVRESWTDGRLDDLNGKVDELGRRTDNGFNRVDADLRALRGEANAGSTNLRSEMKAEFAAVRGEMSSRFERVEGRIDDLHRTMLQLGGGAIATIAVGFLGVIVTQL
jgi:hypothetical protein